MTLGSRLDWIVWIAAAGVAASAALAFSGMRERLTARADRTVSGAEETTPAPALAIEGILALMPFGRPAGPSVRAEPAARGDAPETDLNLALHGVLIANPSSSSRAIVSRNNEPARSLMVGDDIADGMRLVEVQIDHVVIDNGGRRETLSFPDPAPSLPPPDGAASQAGVIGNIDALRELIFNQANGLAEPDPAPSE